MKKISILSLCLLTAAAATAQKAVVKEAESAMKSGKPFTEVVQIITPAFTNPETDKQAQTYYVPGKAGFKEYDDVLGKKQVGMIKGDDAAVLAAANALLGGYDYMMKALPLDSLPDEKGKVKPKYSKDIISTIIGHQGDFNMAAVDFYNFQDYGKAYDCWNVFLTIPTNPTFAEKAKQFPDSTMADIAFNQGIAAWQGNQFEKAVGSFKNAIKYGYDKQAVYDYGIAVATNAKDNDALMFFAKGGNDKFGDKTPMFLNQIVNYYLQTEKYADALAFLNDGIAKNPDNAQYYALEGIIYDNQQDRAKAMELYKKSLDLDANNALGNFYYGRGLAAKAGDLSDKYEGTNFAAYKEQELNPIYKEALTYLEKAYDLDKDNRNNILQVLEICYYNLGDEAGMQSVTDRKNAD